MKLALLGLILGALGALLSTRLLLGMLQQGRALRPNYRGRLIPVGGGVVFFFAAFPALLLLQLLFPGRLPPYQLLAFLALTAITTLVGLLDDLLGSREVSGLLGHFRELCRGRLTTGMFKALIIPLAAFLLFYLLSSSLKGALVDALLVALWANALNLFDLRPGRAAKFFLLAWVLVSVAAWGRGELALLWVVAGALLLFLPWDLRARAMMGDAGSNTLGAVLGLSTAWTLALQAKLGLILGLLFLHLLAERYSLTELIARSRWLDWLDRWGRRDH
ncbi:UDP-N-acetylmuramyl pentapeptide phosphotransferase [Desulfothermobacter acidiphilus]|uniref:UDP-N-acetylmuramyl pentapeptide phosphotransferase n=1 Tax=Desulfothermobacter acidiphilus TaxID=1938353 RepID=UPI003F8B6141